MGLREDLIYDWKTVDGPEVVLALSHAEDKRDTRGSCQANPPPAGLEGEVVLRKGGFPVYPALKRMAPLMVMLLVGAGQPSLRGQNLTATYERANEVARRLLGHPPMIVTVYPSGRDSTNYFAFTALHERCGIWLYKETAEGAEQLWHEELDSVVFGLKIVSFPAEQLPVACYEAERPTASGSTVRIGSFSVRTREADYVEYDVDFRIARTEEKPVSRPLDGVVGTRAVFCARQIGLLKDDGSLDLGSPENMEVAWAYDNPDKRSGTARLRYYADLPRRYDPGLGFGQPRHLDSPLVTSDGRYEWYSFPRGGVVGHDLETGLYFMVYLPRDRAYCVRGLLRAGPWLYMKTEKVGQEWAIRFNVDTHALQSGHFDEILKASQGAEPSGRGVPQFWAQQTSVRLGNGNFPPSGEIVLREAVLSTERGGYYCTERAEALVCTNGLEGIVFIRNATGRPGLVAYGVPELDPGMFNYVVGLICSLVRYPGWTQKIDEALRKLGIRSADGTNVYPQGLSHQEPDYSIEVTRMNAVVLSAVLATRGVRRSLFFGREPRSETLFSVVAISPNKRARYPSLEDSSE